MLAFWAALLIPAFGPHNGVAPYTPPDLNYWGQRLLLVWSHWDGEWFLHIAQNGYLRNVPSSPFFPLFPLLIRLVGLTLGGNYLLAGVIVGTLTGVSAFVLMYELVKFEYGEGLAQRATLYLAAFPASFFLTAIYSEALFLALALGAFLAARRYSNWYVAGLMVALASITRNLGILMLIPLGWEWLRQHRGNFLREEETPATGKSSLLHRLTHWKIDIQWEKLQPVATLAFVIFPMGAVSGWLAFNWLMLGDPLSFMHVQDLPFWNRHSALPTGTLAKAFSLMFNPNDRVASNPPGFSENQNWINLVCWVFAAVLFIGGCVMSWQKKMAFSYILFFAITLILPLFSPSGNQPLMSFPRFTLVIFPAFMVLAKAGQRWKFVHYAYLVNALMLLALLFARFVNWYWVA
ncbi:MAG TPA: mannosyltransferase family protein [Chloroflexia bacterium]|nr:mannosyltransferase family protein [Chloroflexia bacterium]